MVKPTIPTMYIAIYKRVMAGLLTDSCTIEALTSVRDAYGTADEVWRAVGSVSCRLLPPSGKMRESAERIAEVQGAVSDAYRLIVPVETAIEVGNRVTMASGVIFRVVDVLDQRTDATDLQVMVARWM